MLLAQPVAGVTITVSVLRFSKGAEEYCGDGHNQFLGKGIFEALERVDKELEGPEILKAHGGDRYYGVGLQGHNLDGTI